MHQTLNRIFVSSQRPVKKDRVDAMLRVLVEEIPDLPRGPTEPSCPSDLSTEELVGYNSKFDSLDGAVGNFHEARWIGEGFGPFR